MLALRMQFVASALLVIAVPLGAEGNDKAQSATSSNGLVEVHFPNGVVELNGGAADHISENADAASKKLAALLKVLLQQMSTASVMDEIGRELKDAGVLEKLKKLQVETVVYQNDAALILEVKRDLGKEAAADFAQNLIDQEKEDGNVVGGLTYVRNDRVIVKIWGKLAFDVVHSEDDADKRAKLEEMRKIIIHELSHAEIKAYPLGGVVGVVADDHGTAWTHVFDKLLHLLNTWLTSNPGEVVPGGS